MRAVRLIIATTVTAVLVVGVALSTYGARQSQSTEESATGAPRTGYEFDTLQLSIGDTVTNADLIVRAKLDSVGEPVWNSNDGTDWTKQYNENPEAYITIPVPLLPITIQVEDVLLAHKDVPAVQPGSELTFLTLDSRLDVGEVYLLMLSRENLYGEMEKPIETWQGDAVQGAWSVSGGLASPVNEIQAYSLATAIMEGRVQGTVDEATYRGSLTLEEFGAVVDQETESKAVDVAGFKEWPYAPALKLAEPEADADDPGAHADPSEV
jgi:hypothetical protein